MNSPYSIRFTLPQRVFIRECARDAGVTESEWIRQILFSDSKLNLVKHQALVKRANHKDLSQVIYLLGKSRIPNNLNQIAKGINTGTLIVSPDTERHIHDAYRMVLWIRKTLIEQLGLNA